MYDYKFSKLVFTQAIKTGRQGGELSSEKVVGGCHLSQGYKSTIVVSLRGLMTTRDYSKLSKVHSEK